MFGKLYSLVVLLVLLAIIVSIGGCENIMSRGYADWHINTAAVGQYLLDDSELAARLGSPYVYERLGNVLAIDQGGVELAQWITSTSGAGAAIAEDTGIVYSGTQSIKLTPGSSGSMFASIYREIPYIEARNIGVSLLFAPMEAGAEMRVDLKYTRAGTKYSFSFRVTAAGLMQIFNGVSWDTQKDSGRLLWDATVPFWNLLHVSINVTDLTFKSIQLNQNKIAFTDDPTSTGATSVPNSFEVYISALDASGDQDVIYVDNIIVTIDEP